MVRGATPRVARLNHGREAGKGLRPHSGCLFLGAMDEKICPNFEL
jgi:hypothetical protein